MTRLLAPVLLAAGCTWFEPVLDPLSTEPMLVEVGEAQPLDTQAHQPTDLLALPDGGLLVLDSYRGRALRYDAARTLSATLDLALLPHPPSRMAIAENGDAVWMVSPQGPELVRLGLDGQVQAQLEVRRDDEPVAGLSAVLDLGDTLVVGLLEGPVARVDAATGQVLDLRVAGFAETAYGAPVHLVGNADGTLLLTDAFGPRVHRLTPELEPLADIGRPGLWIGALGKPKAAVHGPAGTVVVADSELGVVQVFEQGGQALGALGREGAPIRFDHPVALSLATGQLHVLEAGTGLVHAFELGEAEITLARDQAQRWRHLRTKLVQDAYHERLADGTLCHQCHDGVVLDDRRNWDPDLHHHPVGLVPERPIPDFFPLDEQGRMTCTTCHSPHGTVEVADVEAVQAGEATTALVRHGAREGDLFTRLSRENTELCVACHSEAAHDRVLERLGLDGTAHPTGPELARALQARGTPRTSTGATLPGFPEAVDVTCLTCHSVHAAPREKLNREGSATELCLSCHQDQGLEVGNHRLHHRLEMARAAQDAGLPLDHGAQSCRTCHDLVGGQTQALLHLPQGQLCTTCHEPLQGGHAKVKGRLDQSCLGCHNVHRAPPGPGLVATRVHATEHDAQGCLSCHTPEVAQLHLPHPGVRGHPVMADATCASCHVDPHRPDQTTACGDCHEPEQSAMARGGHGTASCTDCHPAHHDRPALPASLHPTGEDLNPFSANCLACHAPGTEGAEVKVAAWDHPAPVFTLEGRRWTPLGDFPLFDARGLPVPPSVNGDLTCGSCHLTHGPHGEQGPEKLRRPGLERACASCHGEDARRLYQDFHHLDRTWEGP